MTQEHYDLGQLLICPPDVQELVLDNNVNGFDYKSIAFQVDTNYEVYDR